MVRAANPLDQTFDVLGRANLDHQINIAPVDPQIKASGTYNCAQITAHHRGLDAGALFAVKTAVVDADGQAVVIGQPQIVKENLGLGAGVVENQRGVVLLDLVQNGGDCVGGPATRPRRGLIRAQHLDVGGRTGVGQQDFTRIRVTRHQVGDCGGVFDGGRQADAFQIGAKRLQAGERQKHLVAAFGFRQCVDFVDDHAFQSAKHARCVIIADQQRQRFRRRQKNIRRIGALPFAPRGACVAGAFVNGDRQAHFFDRRAQVAFDVSGQRFER